MMINIFLQEKTDEKGNWLDFRMLQFKPDKFFTICLKTGYTQSVEESSPDLFV